MQEQPAQQRLEAGGLAIGGGVTAAGPTTGPIAALPHPVELLLPQHWLQALQGLGLGIGTHLGHHLAMQGLGTTGGPALAQPLMQLPHAITEPGELEGP